MKNVTCYIAWIPGHKTSTFRSYEEAWRHAEEVFAATGRIALIEKVR